MEQWIVLALIVLAIGVNWYVNSEWFKFNEYIYAVGEALFPGYNPVARPRWLPIYDRNVRQPKDKLPWAVAAVFAFWLLLNFPWFVVWFAVVLISMIIGALGFVGWKIWYETH